MFENHVPYARHHRPLLIRSCSWIQAIHKAKGHSTNGLWKWGKKVYKPRLIMARVRYTAVRKILHLPKLWPFFTSLRKFLSLPSLCIRAKFLRTMITPDIMLPLTEMLRTGDFLTNFSTFIFFWRFFFCRIFLVPLSNFQLVNIYKGCYTGCLIVKW